LIERLMELGGLALDQATNQAIRDGLNPRLRTPFVTLTFSMGQPGVDLDKAVALAGQTEDDEHVVKMRKGSFRPHPLVSTVQGR
jgi:hypothetical protein